MIEDITKQCAKCKEIKTLEQFHRQPKGPKGRHSYCAACISKIYNGIRRRRHDPIKQSARNYKERYGLTKEKIGELIAQQGGACAICSRAPMKRPCIDHNHTTGKVRSILCHRCNVGLGFIEAIGLEKATAYLEAHA